MEFIVKENENHQLESIVNKNDKYKMNWVATGKKWGEMFLPDGITGRIERTVSTKGKITEKYIFVNNRDREYFHKKGEIGIAVPFPDNYTAAEICMRERCHAHIRCGESQSYIAGIRMGGEKPNLATVYKGNIIKNLIMDCQSYTKYRPNETTGGIFVSWRRKEELPTGA